MRKYFPLVATLVVIAVNAAANIVPINGVRTGDLSALYPTGFTPAGWVFAIWSLIYAGLLAFSVYAARVGPDESARVSRVVSPYLLSYTAVFAWASLGIVLQTLETDRSVRLAAAAGCAVAAVVSLVSLVQGRKYGRPVSPA